MLLINQISKKLNIPVATIRYYERFGLIKGIQDASVLSNNYYYYNEEVEWKLETITEAKSVGFSLLEIKELLDAWYNEKLTITDKVKVLKAKQIVIDSKIEELEKMKLKIDSLIQEIEETGC